MSEFRDAFRAAALRVRVERALAAAVSSLAVPVLLAATWVLLVRFTLLDLPQWPALIPLVLWGIAMLVIMARTRVSTGQAARYLDHALDLDERLATYVELVSKRGRGGSTNGRSPSVDALGTNALELVEERRDSLPGIRVRASRSSLIAMAVSAVILALAIVSPTPLDAVRLEKQKLAQSVAAQLQRVAELRADFIARPGINEPLRSNLLRELDRLEAALRAPGADQASLLASIADTQERLRELSPDLSSDFDPFFRAGRLVHEAAARNSPWSVTTSKERTDLGRAADASQYLSRFVIEDNYVEDFVPAFSKSEQTDASRQFDSAAGVVSAHDGALAKLLQETSAAMLEKHLGPASRLLGNVAKAFREIEGRQQAAEGVERALSSLDDGKQSIAQTGETKQKKAQVGFRRGQTGGTGEKSSSGKPQSPGGTPVAGSGAEQGDGSQTAPIEGGTSNPTAQSNRVGPNMPAPGSSESGIESGSQPDTKGGSSGQQGDGKGGGAKSGDAGDQPGTQGDSQQGQSDGSPSGPITGGNGGVTGGITKVENPEGVGVQQGDGSGPKKSGGSGDTVSVPIEGVVGEDPSGDEGAGAVPTPGGSTEGADSGIVGTGGSGGDANNTGAGILATIRTPYTEVIGQYIERATTALERAYIPQDAKEYVRDYFTQLGK